MNVIGFLNQEMMGLLTYFLRSIGVAVVIVLQVYIIIFIKRQAKKKHPKKYIGICTNNKSLTLATHIYACKGCYIAIVNFIRMKTLLAATIKKNINI